MKYLQELYCVVDELCYKKNLIIGFFTTMVLSCFISSILSICVIKFDSWCLLLIRGLFIALVIFFAISAIYIKHRVDKKEQKEINK